MGKFDQNKNIFLDANNTLTYSFINPPDRKTIEAKVSTKKDTDNLLVFILKYKY